MHRLPLLIDLILQEPRLPHRKIAGRVGRTTQTVRRYARLIRARGFSPERLRGMSPRELDRFLNGPRGSQPKRTFDPVAVRTAATAAGTSLRQQWRLYAASDPETAVGYKHFVRICQVRAPWKPLPSNPADS